MDNYIVGFLALGSLSNATFTEITAPAYQRQQIAFSTPAYGRTANTSVANFVESAGTGFGAISAVAVYLAPTGGSPLLAWGISPVQKQAYENVSFAPGQLSFTFSAASGLAGALAPSVFPTLTEGSVVGASVTGSGVYAGGATQASGSNGSSGRPATVAAAGTNQATATQLTVAFSTVTTGTGGVMIANAVGVLQIIYNATGSTINVWPIIGMSIGNASANTAVAVLPNRAVGIEVLNASQAVEAFNSSSFG